MSEHFVWTVDGVVTAILLSVALLVLLGLGVLRLLEKAERAFRGWRRK